MSRLHSPRWPDRSQKPPYGSVEIDPGHPLAQGLILGYLGGTLAIPNLAGNPLHRLGITSLASVDATGETRVNTGNNPSVGASSGIIAAPTSMSVAFHGYEYRADAYGCFYSYEAGGAPGFAIRRAETARRLMILGGAGANIYQIDEVDGSAIRRATWVGTWDGVTGYLSLYRDGALNAIKTDCGAGGVYEQGNMKFSLGSNNPAGITSEIAFSYYWVWTRALRTSEVLQVSASPYCFLREVKRRTYAFLGAAAGLKIPVVMNQYRQRSA